MKRMLADVCPELINEWSQRNLPLTPDSVTHGSNKIVKIPTCIRCVKTKCLSQIALCI